MVIAKNECKVRLLDEVTAVVVGLHGDHLEHLYNKFAVPAANYFFNPRFKLGQWDGKIRYFHKTGKTFVYLLEDILPRLVKFGYKVTIEDLRTTEATAPDLITNQVFAHIAHLDTGAPTILRNDQIDAVNKLIEAGSGICLAGTGAGKATTLDTRVLTTKGWIRMGDIQLNDLTIGPDNQVAAVTGVYPQGTVDIYRVEFHDGASIKCCGEHLWEVQHPKQLHKAWTETRVVSTDQVREFLDRKNAGQLHTPGNISIPVCVPLGFYEAETKASDIPLDPYALGVLLGDGTLCGPSINLTSSDQYILDRITSIITPLDLWFSKVKANKYDYNIVGHRGRRNKLKTIIHNLGLGGSRSHTKFIPNLYKTASIDQRWELLRGLMDTDGTVDRRGNCSYSTASHSLAVDVQQLVWSLGCLCSITHRATSYVYKGERKAGRTSYTLFIKNRDPSELFNLPRKKERCHRFGKSRIQLTRRFKSITYVGKQPAQCIMVDHPRHLYITDDFIVTHNTLMCAALVQAYNDIGVKSLTIVPDQGLIRQTKAEYINCGLDTGEYSGTHKTLEHQHIVSTWQALKNNPKIVELFQMVIVDECHGLRGNVLTKLICDHAARLPYRFGFTGTLPKDEAERMSVHVAVGPVRHVMAAKTLIDMGVLADIHIDVIQLEENLQAEYKKFCEEDMPGSKPPTYIQFKDGYFPDFASEKSYIHRNELRIEWIAEFLLAKQDSKRGNILCLVDSIPFGRKLAEQIPGAIFVNGQDIKTASKRQDVYDLFKTRDDLVVIATVHIAGTGLNIKRIFNLVFIDIGKSFTRVIQGIGRGLRKAEDKDSVIVTDICSDLKYGKKHLKMRTNYYEEAQYPFKKHKIDYVKQMDPLAGFE